MPRPPWPLLLQALLWRSLMKIGMFLHKLASPRPIAPTFSLTISSSQSAQPGRIGLTFYTPKDYQARCKIGFRFPFVVNFHGGGFTIGRATDDARWATAVVAEVDAVVVCVEYRLAPEYPFPTAVEDGVDAISFLAEHADELGLDVSRFATSGFSAGGNLAFTVPMMLNEKVQQKFSDEAGDEEEDKTLTRKGRASEASLQKSTSPKPVAVVSWYPPTDFTTPTATRRATCTRPSRAMPSFFVELFDKCYIGLSGQQLSHPMLSPGVAPDAILKALPQDILLFTCEWDMLRAEAEQFGARLHGDIGEKVTHTMVPEVAHAWDRNPNPLFQDRSVSRYYRQACMELKTIFEKPTMEES